MCKELILKRPQSHYKVLVNWYSQSQPNRNGNGTSLTYLVQHTARKLYQHQKHTNKYSFANFCIEEIGNCD